MIDNFKAVREQLQFDSEDDYYFLEILQRKKDFPEEERSSVRDHTVFATYFINSVEKLDRIEKEVKTLCELHNARAYFNPNRKSKKKTAVILMKECLGMVENDDYSKIESRTASAAGQCAGRKEARKFLIDVDAKDRELVIKVLTLIESVNPDVLHYILPSVNGYHLITSPFDIRKFNELGGKDLKNVEIKHNAPTILYYHG